MLFFSPERWSIYVLTFKGWARVKPRKAPTIPTRCFVLTVIVRSISVCLDVYYFLRIPNRSSAGKELSVMWNKLMYTGLCSHTQFMYGINDFVHTTLCSKISLLVFNVHVLFKVFFFFFFFAPFERTPLSSIFLLNI